MATKPAPGEAPRLDAAVDRLAALFRQAQARMGKPAAAVGDAAPRHGHSAGVGQHRAAIADASRPKGTTCGWANGWRTRQRRRRGSGPTC